MPNLDLLQQLLQAPAGVTTLATGTTQQQAAMAPSHTSQAGKSHGQVTLQIRASPFTWCHRSKLVLQKEAARRPQLWPQLHLPRRARQLQSVLQIPWLKPRPLPKKHRRMLPNPPPPLTPSLLLPSLLQRLYRSLQVRQPSLRNPFSVCCPWLFISQLSEPWYALDIELAIRLP